MKHINQFLSFIKLIERGHLSLTNLLFFVITFKIIVSPEFDFATAASLLLVLLARSHKKILNKESNASESEQSNLLSEITDRLSKIELKNLKK